MIIFNIKMNKIKKNIKMNNNKNNNTHCYLLSSYYVPNREINGHNMLLHSPYVNIPLPSVLGRTFMLVLSPVIATFVNFLWINNNNKFSTF